MISRLKSTLFLTPAILLLLLWIASFGNGAAEAVRIGTPLFLAWATAVSFAIAYSITLYVAYFRRG